MSEPSYLLLLTLVAGPALGQMEGHSQHRDHSPYADQEPSGIAALSVDELADLRNGAGMGLARAAELNHYPGPMHVIELAEELNLSDDQLARLKQVHVEMLEEAKRLGEVIVEKESYLNRRFAHKHIDESILRSLTEEIGALRGELRFTHLNAHLRTTAILAPEQVGSYDTLRGYRSE